MATEVEFRDYYGYRLKRDLKKYSMVVIPGFDYAVSRFGEVRRISIYGPLGKPLTQVTIHGKPYIQLRVDGKNKPVLLAKLVLWAYRGEDPNPRRTSVIYLDGDSDNVTPENLYWATRSEASKYAELSEMYGCEAALKEVLGVTPIFDEADHFE